MKIHVYTIWWCRERTISEKRSNPPSTIRDNRDHNKTNKSNNKIPSKSSVCFGKHLWHIIDIFMYCLLIFAYLHLPTSLLFIKLCVASPKTRERRRYQKKGDSYLFSYIRTYFTSLFSSYLLCYTFFCINSIVKYWKYFDLCRWHTNKQRTTTTETKITMRYKTNTTNLYDDNNNEKRVLLQYKHRISNLYECPYKFYHAFMRTYTISKIYQIYTSYTYVYKYSGKNDFVCVCVFIIIHGLDL